MWNQFSRTELLLGRTAMERLSHCKVAVFGIGGVGGYVCEALVRSGVGAFVLVDHDRICESNLNRQIIATKETIGRYKVDVMKERMLSINPEIKVEVQRRFFLPETAEDFSFADYDYVVDAVDTVSAKLELAVRCAAAGTPMISSMGAGNKLDPTAFRIADIYQTKMDPLARVMRRELKKRGIEHLKVVYSEEPPISLPSERSERNQNEDGKTEPRRRSTPGSIAFVPSAAGLVLAGAVIRDLIKKAPAAADGRGEVL